MTLSRLIKQQPFVIILRAVHCRGDDQRQAFEALKARGLWLSDEQKRMATDSISGGPCGAVQP